MIQNGRVSNTEHMLSLGSSRSLLTLLMNSDGIDWQYIPRGVFLSLSTLLSSPFRLYEEIRYQKILESTAIHPSPVFIVGHWRTGTTLLHNLLCQDPSLGYVSTFQSFAPELCLIGEKAIKKPLAAVAHRRHPTREIDNVPLVFDNPEEEELAVANISPHSMLHWYTFPRQAQHYFERYALFDSLSEQDIAEWAQVYLSVLRKATLMAGGRRLVLKNCANTGRIRILLDLFPGAQFLHIYRNPYDVFFSTVHLYHTVLRRSQLQEIEDHEIEALVLRFYRQIMQRFLKDKERIPAGNLVEVKFEDLEAAPLDQVCRVYDGLGLPGFARAEPAFRAHLASIASYQKNHYDSDRQAISRINRHWGFALDQWGYERRDPAGS